MFLMVWKKGDLSVTCIIDRASEVRHCEDVLGQSQKFES